MPIYKKGQRFKHRFGWTGTVQDVRFSDRDWPFRLIVRYDDDDMNYPVSPSMIIITYDPDGEEE